MITEPEISGEYGEGAPLDVLSDADPAPRRWSGAGSGPAFGPGRGFGGGLGRGLGPRLRKPWAQALVGVVAASAVWAGGLYAFHAGQDIPDLHGYHVGESPCSGRTLLPLTEAMGDRAPGATPAGLVRGTALDRAQCMFNARSPAANGWSAAYSGLITVDLHKKAAPGAEFDNSRQVYDNTLQLAQHVESVPGLGDRAYLLTVSDRTRELKVLHGGAVFTLTLSGYVAAADMGGASVERPAQPTLDLGRFRSAMIATVRQVMTTLRQ